VSPLRNVPVIRIRSLRRQLSDLASKSRRCRLALCLPVADADVLVFGFASGSARTRQGETRCWQPSTADSPKVSIPPMS
jgi:hypothetical protein